MPALPDFCFGYVVPAALHAGRYTLFGQGRGRQGNVNQANKPVFLYDRFHQRAVFLRTQNGFDANGPLSPNRFFQCGKYFISRFNKTGGLNICRGIGKSLVSPSTQFLQSSIIRVVEGNCRKQFGDWFFLNTGSFTRAIWTRD